jgi:hypothetical protein
MYALNYMINIYCLRMSDISGAAQTQSQRLLIFTPPPPPVVSKVGQKTTSATNVVITDQPMSGCCLLRFSSSLVSVCCRLFSSALVCEVSSLADQVLLEQRLDDSIVHINCRLW